jgi:hypothetical protein
VLQAETTAIVENDDDPANNVAPVAPAGPAVDEILKHGYDALRRITK